MVRPNSQWCVRIPNGVSYVQFRVVARGPDQSVLPSSSQRPKPGKIMMLQPPE
ncbi:hypothetical protein TRAPUB_1742 [Trametes pubescens]|uniref:Uncharacterized protein n=1 Tax=Trametes pubescens TaxID=154538 RepID=A0A1M2VIM3_TRAPU|nr:hypothetical protein TRAPUB_1742 [Trametes pubescens]